MAQTNRKPIARDDVQRARPAGDGDNGYDPGGPVAQLQSDLARVMASAAPAPAASVAPGEATVRFLSTAGGYVMLAAGYAAVAALIVRLL